MLSPETLEQIAAAFQRGEPIPQTEVLEHAVECTNAIQIAAFQLESALSHFYSDPNRSRQCLWTAMHALSP